MEELNSGIYAITNTQNNHQYIGSAVDIRRRWHEHRSELRRGIHHSPALQHAWNKWGEDAFTFTVLEYVANPKNLIPTEQRYLDRYKPEYNCHPQARSALGSKRVKRPPTEKQRASYAQQRGKPKPQPFSEKQRAHLLAIQQANLTKPRTLWQVAASLSNQGKHFTDVQRIKQSEILKNSAAHKAYKQRPLTEKQRAGLTKGIKDSADARRGGTLSKDHKDKISEGLKQQDRSAYTEKRLSGMRAYNERRHAERLAREQAAQQQNSPDLMQPGLWDDGQAS